MSCSLRQVMHDSQTLSSSTVGRRALSRAMILDSLWHFTILAKSVPPAPPMWQSVRSTMDSPRLLVWLEHMIWSLSTTSSITLLVLVSVSSSKSVLSKTIHSRQRRLFYHKILRYVFLRLWQQFTLNKVNFYFKYELLNRIYSSIKHVSDE